MKKFYLLITPLVLFSFLLHDTAHSQCTNSSSYGNVGAPSTTQAVTISTCNFAGEYATISGCITGTEYTFTATGGASNYLTVCQGSASGTVLGYGPSPLTVTCTSSGSLYLHINTNASCGTENTCRTTKVSCNSCITSSDPCASVTPISCGVPTTFTSLGAGSWASNPCWSSPGQEKITASPLCYQYDFATATVSFSNKWLPKYLRLSL